MDLIKGFIEENIHLVTSGFYIVLAVATWFCLKRIIKKVTTGKTALSHMFYNGVKYVIFIMLLLAVLQEFGINVTKIIAGVGILSAVIGLALQDEFKDFIMGIHIVLDDFFKIGDIVRYGEFEGKVISISLKTSKIQSLADGSVLTVSNRNISEVIKMTGQVDIIVPLTYEADDDYIKETFKKVEDRVKDLEEVTDAKFMGILEYGESAINYKFRYFTEPENRKARYFDVMGIIHEEIMNANIEIPYNKLDVYMVNKNN